MNDETKLPLDVLATSLESFITQLKEQGSVEASGTTTQIDDDEFMRQIGALSDTISHECTKFAMIFTDENPPNAKTSESLSNRLIGMAAAVYKITASLSPNVVGIQFREWMCDAVIDVFRAISALARAAKEGTPNLKAQLKETGTVWEACDRLKAMPKNSLELLLRRMSETLKLVNDAFAEIQEIQAEASQANSSTEDQTDEHQEGTEEDSSSSLSEREKIQLKACVQLIKATKAILSKTSAAIDDQKTNAVSTVANDDELTSLVLRISPVIDDVVSAFYDPPLDPGLDNEVSQLCKITSEVLVSFRKSSYYDENEHSKWLNILRTGIEHNLNIYQKNETCHVIST